MYSQALLQECLLHRSEIPATYTAIISSSYLCGSMVRVPSTRCKLGISFGFQSTFTLLLEKQKTNKSHGDKKYRMSRQILEETMSTFGSPADRSHMQYTESARDMRSFESSFGLNITLEKIKKLLAADKSTSKQLPINSRL